MPKNITPLYFLNAKLYRPSLPDDHILRPRLLTQLEKVEHHQIIMVSAPAGYGKTTLVRAWIDHLHYPNAWVSLDEEDNDLTVFLSYFIASIRSIFPNFSDLIQQFSQVTSLPTLPTITKYLINEIAKIEEDFLLVLDDYHVLTNRDIHLIVEGLLQYPLPHFHLAITSRYDPPIQLSKLRANGKLIELRANDLRFSDAEVASFTEQTLLIKPNADTVKILAEKTEGWAVGLRLATIAIRRWGVSDHQPAILQVDNQYVVDYLVNEVLARCSTAVIDFLLRSSILDRFCAPLCEALMETESLDPTILPQLEQEGLFIESLDNKKEWFRYHKLFRELLRQRLVDDYSPAEVAAMHLRASNWLAAHGYVEDAIDHALLSGDMLVAANILSVHGIALVNNERWLLLERLLNKFSPAYVNNNPKLLLLLAWLTLSKLNFAQLEIYRQALETDGNADFLMPEERRFLTCSIHTFSAIKFNWAGDYEKVIDHAQEALSNTKPEWGLMHAYLWIHMGTATQQLNGGDAGQLILGDDNRLMKDVLNQARKKIAIGFVDWLSGDLLKLTHTEQNGLDLVKGLGLQSTKSMLHFLAGSAFYERNEFQLAEQHFEAVLDLKHGLQLNAFVFSLIGQALIYQAQNMSEDAWKKSETAVNFCLEMEHPSLLFVARAFQAELAARQGRLILATSWAAKTDVGSLSNLMPYLYQPQLTPARIWLADGSPASLQKAEAELTRLHDIVTSTHNIPCQIKVLAMQALLYKRQKNAQLAEEALIEALYLAQPGGFIRVFVDLEPEMAGLLKHLYVQGFVSAFLQQVLKAFPATSKPIPNATQSAALIESLTERELEILSLLAQRLSNKEIADLLIISKETVKRHTSNIYQKLGVKSRRQAVASGYTLGLLVDPT